MPGELERHFPSDFMQCIEGSGRGSFLRVGSDSFFTQRLFYHSASASKIEYVGFSNPGVSISASGWAIKLLTYNASGNVTGVTWAGSSLALNKVLDDRVTYTYG